MTTTTTNCTEIEASGILDDIQAVRADYAANRAEVLAIYEANRAAVAADYQANRAAVAADYQANRAAVAVLVKA